MTQPTAQEPRSADRTAWVTTWAAAANGIVGPSPVQPDLWEAFPDRTWRAWRQSFRVILRPSLTGATYRFRVSNRYGDEPLTIERASLGVHWAAGAIVPGSSRPATFAGAQRITIPPGAVVYSDAVPLPDAPSAALAASLYVGGRSGALTWHADAFTTSYVTAPGAGDHTADESELAFAYATTSWLLVDALDVRAGPEAAAVVALGDSITDGWITTVNGYDRWTDVLARRLAAAYPGRFAVVNQGLCGNQVSAGNPTNPSALARFERDVTGLAGTGAVILFDGTNDVGSGVPADVVIAAMRDIAAKAHGAGLKIFAATLLPRGAPPSPAGVEERPSYIEARRRVNEFIRSGSAFDAMIDFAAVLADPDDPDHLAPIFLPNPAGPGDGLHPNRLAHLRLGEAVPLALFEDVCVGGR